MGQLCHGQRGEGRLARGLGHGGAAHGQGGTGLARDHGGGEVPRGDEAADADGLLDGDDAVPWHGGGDGLAIDAGGLLAEPLEKAGGVGDLAAGVGEGLAVLPGDEGGEVGGVLGDEVVPPAQQLGALATGLGAEGGEGGVGGVDGAGRVLGVELGAGADELAGGRVVDLKGPARGGLDPLAVDVADARLEERRVAELDYVVSETVFMKKTAPPPPLPPSLPLSPPGQTRLAFGAIVEARRYVAGAMAGSVLLWNRPSLGASFEADRRDMLLEGGCLANTVPVCGRC